MQHQLIPTWDGPLLEFQLGMTYNEIPTTHNHETRIALCVIGIIHLLDGNYYKLYGWSDLVDTMLHRCFTASIHPIIIISFEKLLSLVNVQTSKRTASSYDRAETL